MRRGLVYARRWAGAAAVLAVGWAGLLLLAFARRDPRAVALLAAAGHLVWAFPAGLALGAAVLRRRHVAWIFPAAVPVCFGVLYLAFTAGELVNAHGLRFRAFDFNPRRPPGRDDLVAALFLCPVPAAGVAFGFLAHPRPVVRPERRRCIGCDYDVRGSIATGRCPECGRPLIAGIDYPAGT
jgi:hypothetical protein